MGHAPSIFDEPLQPSIKVVGRCYDLFACIHVAYPNWHTLKRPDPPWYPRYLSADQKYKGRVEWWADLKYKEPLTLKGKYRLTLPSFQEWDEHWSVLITALAVWQVYLITIRRWDPELPKGESLHGIFGLDTRYNQNMAKKGDFPMPLRDYQKKVGGARVHDGGRDFICGP